MPAPRSSFVHRTAACAPRCVVSPLRITHASAAAITTRWLAAVIGIAALALLMPAPARAQDASTAAPAAVTAPHAPYRPTPALEAAVRDYEARRYGRAREAFERLAREGDPAAQHNLAVMHLRGELPGASAARAAELLESAAQAGFVTAAFALGQLYDSGRADAQAGRPDPTAALRWYRVAAEAGSVDGQVEVATAYYLGRGVAADPAEALAWYRRAAVAGDVGAQYLVASMYETGLGARADRRLARYWYAAAAAQGDSAAALKARALDDPAVPAAPAASAAE